jgi:ubiquinone/menaquinone biosynthesis C-methylase UbiE
VVSPSKLFATSCCPLSPAQKPTLNRAVNLAVRLHPEISRARAQGRLELERNESDRIRQTYERRHQSIPAQRYSRTNPGHLYALQEREAAMAGLLRYAGLNSLAGLRILDVGCGRGATLRQYLEYEADPEGLWGIDLLSSSIRQAQELTPAARLFCGSASRLPFADASFDLISQFVLFTSVLNFEIRMQIAGEMARVLVPGGKLLWYDFACDNPRNPDVRGIAMGEIRRLFPGFSLTRRRITLAPPLGRAIGGLGPAIYHLTSKLRFLCTHYLCLLEKPCSSGLADPVISRFGNGE